MTSMYEGAGDLSWMNPAAQHFIHQEYDVENGYLEFHRRTKMTFSRNLNQDYVWEGLKKVQMIDENTVHIYRDLIDHGDSKLHDHDYRVHMLETIINPHVDKLIAGYFMSEYAPIWMRIYKNEPTENIWAPANFWHTDSGPSKHLKVLLYLCDTEEIGGNTAYCDKFTTQRFKNAGYLFGPVNKRLTDLSELSKQHNIKWESQTAHIKPGEGIIFEPMNIMHRALWPTKAPRYYIQICFVPAFRPWNEIIKNTVMPTEDNGFPVIQF